MPEWPMGTDCKSVGDSLRRFESFTPHQNAGAAHEDGKVGRDTSRKGHFGPKNLSLRSSAAEHFFGKEEVTGSILVEGSKTRSGDFVWRSAFSRISEPASADHSERK